VPHPFFARTRPLVFAHRGGAKLAPENTMAAFDHAATLGVDGFELDVRLSRDGIVVVHHDATLDRTMKVRGAVATRSGRELAELGVPALADVLTRHRDQRVIIEMKENTDELAARVIDVLDATASRDRACLGAFGRRVLRAARRLAPDVATSAAREEVRWVLYRSWCRWPATRLPFNGYQIPETSGSTRVVSPRFIEEAHRAGLGVQVWTVDSEDDARRLLSWGVDALISDRPDLMLPLVATCSAQR
jgi:glycerophosphoryl diester phosphodiesterase